MTFTLLGKLFGFEIRYYKPEMWKRQQQFAAECGITLGAQFVPRPVWRKR